MSFFGRKGCNEETDWAVIIYPIDGDAEKYFVCEQLAKKEAMMCYKEVLYLFNEKGKLLEIKSTRGNQHSIPKRNIQSISLMRHS